MLATKTDFLDSVAESHLKDLTYIFERAVLYAFFGFRLLYIAWRSTDSKSNQKKEMEEVCGSQATYVASYLLLN